MDVVEDRRECETGVARFPIVGIAASAGDVEAAMAFLEGCPAEADMAFVLVFPRDADLGSGMAESLQRQTRVPVAQVEGHTRVLPGHAYVAPPEHCLAFEEGALWSAPVVHGDAPIALDRFFHSLARHAGERAVGIVLSGSGSEGSGGLKAIREAGGVALVRCERDSEGNGTPPQAAAASGPDDFVLPLADIPVKLLELTGFRPSFANRGEGLAGRGTAPAGSNAGLVQLEAELASARELLQSANKELLAVNRELQARNDDLARSNADLDNLLGSTEIAALFLDGQLRVRRFSPRTADIFGLVAGDVGRSYTHIADRLAGDDLLDDLEHVLRDPVTVERELGGRKGRLYQTRLQPCRNIHDQVDGVIMTFTDVTDRHRHCEDTGSLGRQPRAQQGYAESIVETAGEPILVLDSELRVVTANRAFHRSFKTSPEATRNVRLYDLGDRQWNIPALRRLLEEILPQRTSMEGFEVRHDFGDGERILLLSARRLRRSEDAEPLILLVFDDATERTRSAGVLAASEKKYRDLFDSIDEGFCIIEVVHDDAGEPIDYRFLEVNPAFARNTGLEDAVGRTAREMVPDQEQHWIDIYARVAETGEPIRFEKIEEGLRRWFDVYALRVGEPGQRRVALLFQDVTARKRHERDLVQLASIVDSSDDAIISKDLHGVVVTWNRAAEQMFGYSAEEAIGHTIAELIIPMDRSGEEDDILARIGRGEVVDHFETVRHRKDGTTLAVSVTISPLRDSAGRIIGASKIARDISERRRAEQHRELLIHELNHRVKNTLATVQALAMQTFRGPGLHQALDTFEARLLALSAAHDVLTRENWQGADIREIVRNAVAAWRGGDRSRIRIGGPKLRLRPAAALALSMALHELATNAAKYGALLKKGGTITIEWSIAESGPPCFRLHWVERGGPPTSPPIKRGFGSRLIEYGLAQDLGGTVQLAFEESGVECTIEAPIGEIREQGAMQ